jgi:heme/copper-type cytochrome/quinol oxidase subunit 2
MDRRVVVPLVLGLLVAGPSVVRAQCAMCGAAAASSSGVARGIALSVFFLLGTLFLVVGWLVVLVLRSQVRVRGSGDAPAATSGEPSVATTRLPTGHAPAGK